MDPKTLLKEITAVFIAGLGKVLALPSPVNSEFAKAVQALMSYVDREVRRILEL